MRSKQVDDEYDEDDEDDIDAIHPVDDLWTPALVGKALVAALRMAMTISGPTGPKSFGSAMPAIFRDEADYDGWPMEDIRPSRQRVTSVTVTKVEDALHWQSRYLVPDSKTAVMFKVWLRTKLSKKQFGAECKRRGWARQTAYDARDRALSTIAQGLTRDGAKLWR